MKSRRSFITSGSLLIGSLAATSQGFGEVMLSASQKTHFTHLKTFKVIAESSKLLRGSLSLIEFQHLLATGASLTDSAIKAAGNTLQFSENGREYHITLCC